MSKTCTRRSFLGTVGYRLSPIPFLSFPSRRPGPPARPPNVVLLITDDQGYGDLGCLGNPVIRTANFDSLYRTSVRLRNFHVSPTCAPTRASLMTGRYANRCGVWHTIAGRSLLFEDEVTMAEIFSAAGYRTGIFGKWHLGDNYPFRPQDRGFHEVLIHGGGGVGQTPDRWGNDYTDDVYFHNGVPRARKGYCTDVWFESALEFITLNRGGPFFCYLSTNAPHRPWNVPEEYSRYYLRRNVEADLARFYGMIHNIDENVGRLLEHLRSLDLEEDTILIFLTDNGSAATSGYGAGLRGRKGSVYEGGHRVPCFIRWPGGGVQGGSDLDQLSAHIDLLPTLIDLCGLQRCTQHEFDGISLAAPLQKEKTAWPERVLITDSQRVQYPVKWRRSSVMSDRWRLIDGKELYDIELDPQQQQEITRKHPDVVQQLRQAYEKWWEGLAPRFEKEARIVVGSEHADPAWLTCHDFHSDGPVPWDQRHILQGLKANGYWSLMVDQEGEYEIGLRRWPPEVEEPITGAVPGGVAIRATKARLKIAEHDVKEPVPGKSVEVRFRVHLQRGPARLKTWFIAGDESRAAYYVRIGRIAG